MGLKGPRVMGASQPSKGVVAVVVVATVVTSEAGKRDGSRGVETMASNLLLPWWS